MKTSAFILAAIVCIGCTQQPVRQQGVVSEIPVTEAKKSTKEVPRIAYLKDQALMRNLKLDAFHEVDSPFSVMKAIEEGRLTTDDLSDSMFYFKDSNGNDTGYFYNSTQFKMHTDHRDGKYQNQ